MSPTSCHAWILLSVPDQARSLDQVIGIADAINHAIPTRLELQDSLGFLRAAGLIAKTASGFCLTDSGRSFLAHARNPPIDSIFDTWNRLETELSRIQTVSFEPESISESEFTEAFDAYKAWFEDEYRKFQSREET